ncbi:MAG: translocation/assembly module TamB domain-containing protein [Treponema sp.]|nr:translocation/assembly module TamB domain-containing protein [Treponema sp.]
MRRWVRNTMGVLAFLLLVGVVITTLRPLYKRIDAAVRSYEAKFTAKLQETTGLGFTYRSLSPSLLTGIHFRGIEIYDADTGENLLTIRNAVMKYSLRELLKGNFDKAFSKLLINDVTFEFDRRKSAVIIEKLTKLASSLSEPEDSVTESTIGSQLEEMGIKSELLSDETIDAIRKAVFAIPFAVQLKNVTIHYSDEGLDAQASIKSMDLNKESGGQTLSTKIKGNFLLTLAKLDNKTLGAVFTANGNLYSNLSGSSVVLALDKHNQADYSIYSTEIMVRYSGDMVDFRTTKKGLPYSAIAQFNIGNGDFHIDLSTSNLNPFSVVKLPQINSTISMMQGMRVTTDASFDINVMNSRYKWNATGSMDVPPKIARGERLIFNMSGNNTDLNIKSLKAQGPMLGASFTGTFNIPRLMPAGVLSVSHFTMPNGESVSGDIYIDPMTKGFTCFIPQLYLGDQVFTAAQAEIFPSSDSVDFTFVVNDYSHMEAEQPGELSVSGTVGFGRKTDIQAEVVLDRFYLDSIASTIASLLEGETKETVLGFVPKLEPYISSGEMYISTDTKTVTYNVPYLVLANTQKDREVLLLSFDGTDRNVSVSQLDLVYGNQAVQATVDADMDLENGQIIFMTSCNLNSIPYEFSGIYSIGQWLSISGDYGFQLSVNFDNPITGNAQLAGFPLALNSMLFSLSSQVFFSYSNSEGIFVEIESFEVAEIDGNNALQPKVSLMGNVDDKGVIISEIAYVDSMSELNGDGYALWDMGEDGFEDLRFAFTFLNEYSGERIDLDGKLKNPEPGVIPFNGDTVMELFDFEANAKIQSFLMSRFLPLQQDDDTLNGSLTATGTLADPVIKLTVDSLSLQLAGENLNAKGVVDYSSGTVIVSDCDLSWQKLFAKNISGIMDLRQFNGQVKTDLEFKFDEKNSFNAPITISLESPDLPPERETMSALELLSMPENLSVYLDSEALTSTFFTKKIPIHIELQKMPGIAMITSDESLGVSGYIQDDGSLNFLVDKKKPFNFNLSGSIRDSVIDLDISDLYLDMSAFSYLLNSDMLTIYKGVFSGNVNVSGLVSDPILEGFIVLDDIDINSPNFIPEHLTASRMEISLSQDEMEVPSTVFHILDSTLDVSAHVQMDRWAIDDISFFVATRKNGDIPIDINVPLVRLKGMVGLDLKVSYTVDEVNITGDMSLRNSEISVIDNLADLDFSSLVGKKDEAAESINMNVDLSLNIGQKVNFIVNPILRGLVAPDTNIHLTMDTANALWSIAGDVVLRGGEVFYLSRNFYLKEGRIILNETQNSFDPYLTVRAETRERDERGDPVTISLEAVRQNISQFNPVLTASPAKSESEIMALLGQIATGDSTSVGGVVATTSDFLAQTLFVRKIENALRDFLNFDIFSLRTTVLQNAITQGLSGNNENMDSIGNYFDNTTVYIGKYFGSTVYADALMQLTYDKSAEGLFGEDGGLIFHPEVGLEFAAPFANIRWQFAPDLGALDSSWVPATSITLSWRMQF